MSDGKQLQPDSGSQDSVENNFAPIPPSGIKKNEAAKIVNGVGSALGTDAPGLHFTNFYNRHCYKLLVAVCFVNALVGIYLFLNSPQTAWSKLIPLLILTLFVVGALFSFVEDKNKVHLSKRITTFAVTLAVAGIQCGMGLAKDEHYALSSRIDDPDDVARFRAAYQVVLQSDYEPGDERTNNILKAIPILEDLTKKYQYHRQVLHALGLAQFELGNYENAKKSFEQLNRVSPNDFDALYNNLGITVKKLADTLEKQEQQNEGHVVPDDGSPTSPWLARWHPPTDEKIRSYRLEAKAYLETSLSYYYESSYRMESGIGLGPKIARNIGWLCYQLSDGCQNEQLH